MSKKISPVIAVSLIFALMLVGFLYKDHLIIGILWATHYGNAKPKTLYNLPLTVEKGSAFVGEIEVTVTIPTPLEAFYLLGCDAFDQLDNNNYRKVGFYDLPSDGRIGKDGNNPPRLKLKKGTSKISGAFKMTKLELERLKHSMEYPSIIFKNFLVKCHIKEVHYRDDWVGIDSVRPVYSTKPTQYMEQTADKSIYILHDNKPIATDNGRSFYELNAYKFMEF